MLQEEITVFEESVHAMAEAGDRYCLIIDATAIEGEMNKRNIGKLEIVLSQFLQMLSAKNDNSFATATRNIILHLCSPELHMLQDVCQQFAMSDRSFQRRLSSEGTSFRNITTHIKKELAPYLQTGNKMKTQDIAFLLGYSEASAYLHAAKKLDKSIT